MSLLGIPLADPRPPHLAPLLALAALAPCGPLLAQDNIRCRRQAVHACAAAHAPHADGRADLPASGTGIHRPAIADQDARPMTLLGIRMAHPSRPHLAPLLARPALAPCSLVLARDHRRSERVLAVVATFAARPTLAEQPRIGTPGP